MRRPDALRSRALLAACAVAALVATAGPVAPAVAARPAAEYRTVTFTTVPAVAGVRVRSGGRVLRTDANGQVTTRVRTVPGAPRRLLRYVPPRVLRTRLRPGLEARFGGYFDGGRTIALSLYRRTHLSFVDLEGAPVPARQIDRVQLKSSTGVRVTLRRHFAPMLQATRVVRARRGVRTRSIQYALERVDVEGGNVVHRAKRRFLPLRARRLRARLLLFSARFTSRDAVFGNPTGAAILLRYPSGRVARIPLRDGEASVDALPRGDYAVRVEASGYSFERPVALSRDQLVDLQVVSYLDLVVVFGGIGALAGALLLVRRPLLRRRLTGLVPHAGRRA